VLCIFVGLYTRNLS